MYVFLLPTVFFMFYIATHMKHMKLESSEIYKRLRIIGVLIFFIHQLVYQLVNTYVVLFISKVSNIYITNKTAIFVLTLLLSFVFAIFIERLSVTRKFKVLRYLYS